MRLLVLSCCAIGLAVAAFSEEQLAYGLARLYTECNEKALAENFNVWMVFTSMMMGWHINGKARKTTQKERTMEGLHNLEGILDDSIYDFWMYDPFYAVADPIDMEPTFGKVLYNDTLSYLLYDHFSYTLQQMVLTKWKNATTEVERILVSQSINMTGIPVQGAKGYQLIANVYGYFAELNGRANMVSTEIARMKEISILFDSMKNSSLALQDEFNMAQRRIVYTVLRQPKGDGFEAAMEKLLFDFVRDQDAIRILDLCMDMSVYWNYDPNVMPSCLTDHDLAYVDTVPGGYVLNKTRVLHYLVEFALNYNVHRDGPMVESARSGLPEDLNYEPKHKVKSFHSYDVIHEVFTNIFFEMGSTGCAKPKLDKLLANMKAELSPTIKFEQLRVDLLDVLNDCWKWE